MLNKNITKQDYYLDKYDVFHSYLVSNAEYDGSEELPCIKSCNIIPNKIITFSEALKTEDYNQWVMFYEHDYKFYRIWNYPRKYIKFLKKFNGVISPDFSMYANMPLVLQKYSLYQGRALANFWIENGINVIPNVRLGDERSYDFAFDGLNKHEVISIGTIGCMKNKIEKELIIKGINKTIEVLEPSSIIIYGTIPDEIVLNNPNIKFVIFKNNNYATRRINNGGRI